MISLSILNIDKEILSFYGWWQLSVCLFAFSTILFWSYYGLQAWKYLFGRGKY